LETNEAPEWIKYHVDKNVSKIQYLLQLYLVPMGVILTSPPITGFSLTLGTEMFDPHCKSLRAKGGFYSERADAFVISPNRRT
jgi:hypothetical protein